MHIYLSFILFIGLAFSDSDVKYQDYERKKGYEEILFDLLDNESTLPELKNLMGEQVYIRMFEDLEKLRKKYSKVKFQKDTTIIKRIKLKNPYTLSGPENWHEIQQATKECSQDYYYQVLVSNAESAKLIGDINKIKFLVNFPI